MTEVEEGSAERSLLRLFGPAVLSSLTASGLGFIYWVVAARYYTPAQVGTSGSTISLITGIGVAASGGLYAVLLRTLTVHQNPRRLLWVTCGIVAAIGAIAGLIAGLLHLSTTDVPLLWLWLAVTSAVWSLFVLQDSILISLRKTTALFASNVGFGAVKLLLLGVFAGTSLGILTAWAIPLVLVVPVVALVADRSVDSLSPIETSSFLVTRGHVAAEYVTSLAVVVVFGGVPVIVSLVSGGAFTGIVYVCWMLYLAADSAAVILSSAVVSSATERHLDAAAAVRSARSAVPVLLGLLLIGVVIAPWILAIFGHSYTGADLLLRLLLIAVMIRVIGNLSLGVRRVTTEFWNVATAQVLCAVVVSVGVAVTAAHRSLAGIGLTLIAGSLLMTIVAISPVVITGLRGSRSE